MASEPNATTHAGDGMVGAHGSMADHGDAHGHDDHAHAGAALGPLDLRAWGAGLLGILLGLAIALSLALAGGVLHF
ncbi:MAG TPA: hypothetical protein VKR30_05580 [Candidatus Limnocylindrales bacterium]|nr:hypothetical protein [Candidatus Limnocylindrales bacterium]